MTIISSVIIIITIIIIDTIIISRQAVLRVVKQEAGLVCSELESMVGRLSMQVRGRYTCCLLFV